MAKYLNRLDPLVYVESANSAEHPDSLWLRNPSLGHLVGVVPQKYWKVVGDAVIEMNPSEKAQVDADEFEAKQDELKQNIKDLIFPGQTVLEGLDVNYTVNGLQIAVDVDVLFDVTFIHTVVPDPTEIKRILVSLVYDETTDNNFILVRERTTGAYADLSVNEFLAADIVEFRTPAAGTALTVLNDWIQGA